MTSTLHPIPNADVSRGAAPGGHRDLADRPDPAVPTRPDPMAPTRRRWPILGAIGGIAGFAAVFAGFATNDISEEEANTGVEVIAQLQRGGYHAGFLLGLVSVGTLLVAASGWSRWAERRAPDDLAARTIGRGLSLTAAVTSIFACFMGALAVYLPGGSDHGWQPDEQLYVTWSMLDFGIMLAWWGVAVSAVCVAVLAFRRDRVLPRWMGFASVVLLLPAVAFAVVTGLPGFVGATMPIWLVVVSVGMTTSRHPGLHT